MSDCNCKDLRGDIVRLQDTVNQMSEALMPFTSGHPLNFLTETSDIAAFDTITGWGSGVWSAWAIANGNSYTRNSVTVQTYDMRDLFPVGAGISYAVGQTGGEAAHTLTQTELPVITPTLIDPGHTHAVTDAGHDHTVVDPGHTHASNQGAHTHPFTTNSDGLHSHTTVSGGDIMSSASSGKRIVDNTGSSEILVNDSLAGAGIHSHTGVTDPVTPAITVASAFTGIGNTSVETTGIVVDSSTTGITINSFGGGNSHNNLPPYRAGIWVQRIA